VAEERGLESKCAKECVIAESLMPGIAGNNVANFKMCKLGLTLEVN
jgi:hypothetical protein